MILLSTLATLALSGSAFATSPAGWSNAPVRAGGYEKVSAKFYIDPSSDWRTGRYAATQPSFSGHDVQYFGLQPQSSGPYTGRVLFSVFGKGSTVGDPARCRSGADGGSGVSCSLDTINLNAGEWYEIVSEVVEQGPLGRRWNGTLIDGDGRKTYIASFWTDDSYGTLTGAASQWLEWFPFNGIISTTTPAQRDCEPFFDVSYELPVWSAGGDEVRATRVDRPFVGTIDDKCAVAANSPNYVVSWTDEGLLNIKSGIHDS